MTNVGISLHVVTRVPAILEVRQSPLSISLRTVEVWAVLGLGGYEMVGWTRVEFPSSQCRHRLPGRNASQRNSLGLLV